MTKWDYDGPILEIDNLSISFFTRLREIPAVMDFSCTVQPGEAMGLVGESGCGKSTVALGVMRDLGKNGRIVGGSIRFKGRDLTTMSEEELREIRGSEIAMIYQEPMASLNPAMKIGQQLMEVPMIHEGVSKAEAWKRALEVVTDVRLPDPERMLKSYPHQLSGGQQQRIVIAMALMTKPALLILDEPTTALDVTVEAAVVDLVKDLGKKYGTSMLFISHNLGLVLGWRPATGFASCIPARRWKRDRSRTSSTRCATPIRRRFSGRSRCRGPTRIPARWWRFRATSPCPTNARRAAISARAATISRPAAATRKRSRWPRSRARTATTRAA